MLMQPGMQGKWIPCCE